jgi:hypothetical protein
MRRRCTRQSEGHAATVARLQNNASAQLAERAWPQHTHALTARGSRACTRAVSRKHAASLERLDHEHKDLVQRIEAAQCVRGARHRCSPLSPSPSLRSLIDFARTHSATAVAEQQAVVAERDAQLKEALSALEQERHAARDAAARHEASVQALQATLQVRRRARLAVPLIQTQSTQRERAVSAARVEEAVQAAVRDKEAQTAQTLQAVRKEGEAAAAAVEATVQTLRREVAAAEARVAEAVEQMRVLEDQLAAKTQELEAAKARARGAGVG